jgi:hypothetical protein
LLTNAASEDIELRQVQALEADMAIELDSPLWAVLSDWMQILLTLRDPPPEQLGSIADAAALTAINGLAERLSPQYRDDVRAALAPITQRVLAIEGRRTSPSKRRVSA